MHADGRMPGRQAPQAPTDPARAQDAAPAGPGGGAGMAAHDDRQSPLPTPSAARLVALVIEDEPNIAEAIRFILARDGWEVLTHARGNDALARIEAVAPQLLILDVMLPGQNGMEILQALRNHPLFVALPVIILTARGQMTDRDAALRNGASLFMAKPFSNADLLEAARRLARA